SRALAQARGLGVGGAPAMKAGAAAAAAARQGAGAPRSAAKADNALAALPGNASTEEDDDEEDTYDLDSDESTTEQASWFWSAASSLLYKAHDPMDLDARSIENEIRRHMENPTIGPRWFWQYQLECHRIYLGSLVTGLVIIPAIMGNFVAEIIQRTPPFIPKSPTELQTWRYIENTFNVIFLTEVIFHGYSEWWTVWKRSGGNWFDFVVVLGGSLDLFGVDFAGLDVVLMLRAVRIFRLVRALRIFSKVGALAKIMNSLLLGAGQVAQALGIVVMIMLIYAVIAVDQYCGLYCASDVAPYRNMEQFVTARGVCFGEDYYGDTGRALYTMFQVLTGESWSEAAVRPIMYRYATSQDPQDQQLYIISQIFFVSFVVGTIADQLVRADKRCGCGAPQRLHLDPCSSGRSIDEASAGSGP
ncbi:unnamed protein product, partial [Prorocentrum cordatum]